LSLSRDVVNDIVVDYERYLSYCCSSSNVSSLSLLFIKWREM